MIARYAGMQSVRFSSSNLRCAILVNIRNPTKIRAGAVANEGIAVKIGAKRTETRNRRPVTRAVSPVRPPTATPAEDSTNVVTVEVPRTAPDVVPIASARRAGFILGSLPFSSSILALALTPISVPSVSNMSTKRKEKIITMKSKIRTEEKSNLKHRQNVSPSFEKSVVEKVGMRE